jgi:DNA-binding response OmpR family regulator
MPTDRSAHLEAAGDPVTATSRAYERLLSGILTEFAQPVPAARMEDEPVSEPRVAVVVEDEEDIRSLLATVLEQAGFTVHTAATGDEGLALVRAHSPLVTTLDVNMPGMDGFETAKRIRAISATYIVMLTARTEEIDALMGLDSGADDYVTKPFRPRELRARIEAMLRRPRVHVAAPAAPVRPPAHSGGAPAAAATSREQEGWLEHKGVRLHPDMRIAMLSGRELDLTRSEFDLLADLLASGRRVLSKSHLALMLRGDEYTDSGYVSDSDARAIEVHMANLRRKLGESPADPQWIETVRGAGYRLTAP